MDKALTSRINDIQKKVHHLAEQNLKLVAKNKTLEQELTGLRQALEDEAGKTAELNNQIKIIKLARNIGSPESGSTEVTELKRKINEYIKEIDHCIMMLND